MRQKWSHSIGGYVFGKGRGEDVGREEREGVGDFGGEVDCNLRIVGAAGCRPRSLTYNNYSS